MSEDNNNSGDARVHKFSSEELKTWKTDETQKIFFGDVFDEADESGMGVTFIRWGKGESGEFDFPLPYDEIFIVTKGSYTVRTESGEITAVPGEVLYLRAGTTGVYYADEDAEVVAITSPPYRRALRKAGFGDQLDLLRNVEL